MKQLVIKLAALALIPVIEIGKLTGWYYNYDVRSFRKRYFKDGIVQPDNYTPGTLKISGIKVYEWVMINKRQHKRFNDMMRMLKIILDHEPLMKSEYDLIKAECDAGLPNEADYILTPENFHRYKFPE